MTTKSVNRIFAMLFAIAMCASLLPAASEAQQGSGGFPGTASPENRAGAERGGTPPDPRNKPKERWPFAPQLLHQLPQFCLGKYIETQDLAHYIPRSCGVRTNHYCAGVAHYLHSQQSELEPGKRVKALKIAQGNVRYTLRGLEPTCPSHISQHVNMMKAQVDSALERALFLQKLGR